VHVSGSKKLEKLEIVNKKYCIKIGEMIPAFSLHAKLLGKISCKLENILEI
jgi:hypothetical protein